MRMKTRMLLGLALGISLFTTSCSDFLTEDPKGRLTPETYFSTQDELNMSVYALYQKINQSQIYANMQYPQWQGDDITTNPGSNKQAAAEIDRFSVANNNKGLTAVWNMHYGIIKAANFIIANAEKTPTSEEEINIALGQAKYWRGYAYFTLVRLFGSLPMNLDNVNDDYTLPLTPAEGVYEQIVKDLTGAEAVLPTGYKDAPRFMNGVNIYVTCQGVKATLAAVYMAMAGWPLNKTEYYTKAAEKAREVIAGVSKGIYEYELNPDYKDVYAMNNNYNNETVVGINYSPISDWAQDSQLTSCNLFESQGGWGDAWGEIRFWKEFPEGPRKDATYDPKIRLKDGTLVDWWKLKEDGTPIVPEHHPMFSIFSVNWNPASKVNINAPYDYKLPASQNMTNDHRHRIIRYSEVLLWYAEAKARTGQTDDLAFKCLNDVRQRAGLEPRNGLAADDLAEAAYKEHGWEVAGYWVALVTRRADQFRMNRLKDTFKERSENTDIEVAEGIKVKESVEYTNKTWNDNLMYLPYPDMDSQKNPNLTR